MQASILLNNRIYEIKKKIHLLEWDISVMKDNSLKTRKEIELKKIKAELKELEGLSHKKIIEEMIT